MLMRTSSHSIPYIAKKMRTEALINCLAPAGIPTFDALRRKGDFCVIPTSCRWHLAQNRQRNTQECSHFFYESVSLTSELAILTDL